jgi:hypothetical protein
MNAFVKTLSAALAFSLGTLALAQAPIVRQPPSDQQPQYSAPPADASQPPYQQAPPDQQAPQPYQQAPPDQQAPPPMSQQQIEGLVNRIALYPDPLLAQTLTAATYWDELPDAAKWADAHAYLHGDQLSAAITADNLPWDPSVLALLPFPSVLDMMARDPDWTGQLGNAVLGQRDQVMDAVQDLRQQAYRYGYLHSNADVDVVDQSGYVEIQPINPYVFYVPVYDPLIVFGPPRPGLYVGGVIRFGPAVTLGLSFGRFGWFGAGFGWGAHTLLIDHRPWTRTYANRGAYVHPYSRPYVRSAGPRSEQHRTPPRDSHDRH